MTALMWMLNKNCIWKIQWKWCIKFSCCWKILKILRENSKKNQNTHKSHDVNKCAKIPGNRHSPWSNLILVEYTWSVFLNYLENLTVSSWHNKIQEYPTGIQLRQFDSFPCDSKRITLNGIVLILVESLLFNENQHNSTWLKRWKLAEISLCGK